jgi:hypothetical protein
MIGLFSSLQGSLGAACSSRSMERVPRNSKAGVFFVLQSAGELFLLSRVLENPFFVLADKIGL